MTCKFCGQPMEQTQTYIRRPRKDTKYDRPEIFICFRCGSQVIRQTTGTKTWETPLYEVR